MQAPQKHSFRLDPRIGAAPLSLTDREPTSGEATSSYPPLRPALADRSDFAVRKPKNRWPFQVVPVIALAMGGMIAQIVAIEHPERVKSLTSIMSTSGDRALPGPKGNVLRALIRPRPRSESMAIRRMIEFFHLVGGSGYPPTEVELQAKVERSVRRSYRPDGLARQLIAIQTAPSRVRTLRRVKAPTLVLHGSEDPLIPMAGGEDTAANIPGARLRIVPGMGHFLPETLVPLLVDEIAGHCLAAEGAAQSRVARTAGSSP